MTRTEQAIKILDHALEAINSLGVEVQYDCPHTTPKDEPKVFNSAEDFILITESEEELAQRTTMTSETYPDQDVVRSHEFLSPWDPNVLELMAYLGVDTHVGECVIAVSFQTGTVQVEEQRFVRQPVDYQFKETNP